MKNFGIVLILSLVLLLQFDPSATRAQTSSKVLVYYFHNQFRCPSCMHIEELTRKAVNKGFQKELANGSITFLPVNIDEQKNMHFIDDYKLITKSVILSKTVDGKQAAWKNLPLVWKYLGDENAFIKYIQTEVNDFMK